MIQLNLKFQHSTADAIVERICSSWENTPFVASQNSREAIDCSHFAARVLDELEGTDSSHRLVGMPGYHAGLHRQAVLRAIRAFLTAYPALLRRRTTIVLAGDILVSGPEKGGPGHLHVVGGKPSRLWQATPPQVQYSGYCLPEGRKLFGIYRSIHRSSWPC